MVFLLVGRSALGAGCRQPSVSSLQFAGGALSRLIATTVSEGSIPTSCSRTSVGEPSLAGATISLPNLQDTRISAGASLSACISTPGGALGQRLSGIADGSVLSFRQSTAQPAPTNWTIHQTNSRYQRRSTFCDFTSSSSSHLSPLRRDFHSSSSASSSAPPAARDPSKIRNFAIIAHIDHGKTTLMDRLLAACGHGSSEDRAMDSHSLEKERGITILAKVTSFTWGDYYINAVDTPGHADFGGEVERVLGLVDGCVLLVDAAEGPLAQTKYVVAKALARGLRPIVLLNKVDRPAATPERCAAVANSLLDLFVGLGASDEQLDFPLLYASAKQGWASRSLPPNPALGCPEGMSPLLDTIVAHVPPPAAAEELGGPFKMGVAMIERDPYVGRIATG
ncbi:hypothetical protein Agub_g13751, partial [Astrephomene gubernaculifera]